MAQSTCSFCGRNKKDVDVLVSGISAHICNFCIEQAFEIVGEDKKNKKSSSKIALKLKKPKELTEYLDQYVIGQKGTYRRSLQPLQALTAKARSR
jgi:ATP-dependent Clp protease ATP-binding subunit ClpX